MKKELVSLLTLALIGSVAVYATNSFFSDQETSSGNTFQAGSLDLKINSTDNPGVLVGVPDLKPGDNYKFEKKLKVVDNSAYVWVMLSDIIASQSAQTEPEIEEENGIPKDDLQNYLLYDLISSTGTVIQLDDQISVASASGCWIPLGSLPGNQEVTIKQSFHLPDTVTNWAQGDTLTFTENFYAVQDRNNPNAQPPSAPFVWDAQAKQCLGSPPLPPPSPTPKPDIVPFIVSNNSWRSSQTEEPDWFLPGHDDSGWSYTVAPSIGLCPSSLNFPNTVINEHGALPMWTTNPVEWGTAYFRKHFYLPFGNQGSVRAVFDDTGDVYINGNLVLSDTINNGDNLVTSDVTNFLHIGDNVIAIRDSDTAGICQTIQFELALDIHDLVFADNQPLPITPFNATEPQLIPQGYNMITFSVSSTGTIENWAPMVSFDNGVTFRNQHRFICNGGSCPDVTIPIISPYYKVGFGTSSGNVTVTADLSNDPGAQVLIMGNGVSLPFVSQTFDSTGYSTITVTVEQANPQNLTGISLQRFEGGQFVEKHHLVCDGGAVCPLNFLPLLGGNYRVIIEGSNPDALVAAILRS